MWSEFFFFLKLSKLSLRRWMNFWSVSCTSRWLQLIILHRNNLKSAKRVDLKRESVLSVDHFFHTVSMWGGGYINSFDQEIILRICMSNHHLYPQKYTVLFVHYISVTLGEKGIQTGGLWGVLGRDDHHMFMKNELNLWREQRACLQLFYWKLTAICRLSMELHHF